MPAVVVIGGQWGDEGKGRIVDLLAKKAQVVARYSAGNNAGHTVVNSLGEFRLHLVPAGIFYPDKVCVIGNGVVVDPAELLREVEELHSQGVSVDKLYVSDRAHVLMPYHSLIDRLDEKMRGAAAIGTTGKGVGPAFTDKVARLGIRMADLIDPEALHQRLALVLPYKNAVLQQLYGSEPLPLEEVCTTYAEYGRRLAPLVTDTAAMAQAALARGDTVLLEGAQGTLLDLDAGTYEYVTSAVPSSMAAGAAIGIGIGPTQINSVLGIYKAYTTRVGNGPMPTELKAEIGDLLRQRGMEYGATTGRARRCGWFDAVAARHTARLNGLSAAVLTRLDVLDHFPTIRICTAYRLDGTNILTFPASASSLARCQPLYDDVAGWQEDTSCVRRFVDLPLQAQAYVHHIETLLGCPIHIVSVGPERDQAIVVKSPL
ncbi:MAG: adenylosuccinate synthase [Dehalococcoidia bacterium]